MLGMLSRANNAEQRWGVLSNDNAKPCNAKAATAIVTKTVKGTKEMTRQAEKRTKLVPRAAAGARQLKIQLTYLERRLLG